MKVSLAIVASLVAGGSAFVPVQQQASSGSATSLDACITKAEILKSPDTTEMGKMWDPLGLVEGGSDETVAWFRHSEVKHGRIAMAAVR
jgi:Chlorophyll A-B binding protein